jgi:putative membrane protein
VKRDPFLVLAALLAVAVAWSAFSPFDPLDYAIEIAVPIVAFVALAATRGRFRFTTLSYTLLFCEALLLVVGAHYTHERVPLFDWIRDAVGGQRNHYDRFAHFGVGFLLVIPFREVLRRQTPLRGAWLNALAASGVLAFAGFYEITEWWIAVLAAPGTAEAYLGSQGDPWDAQKDMLLDALGALTGLLLLARIHDRTLSAISS